MSCPAPHRQSRRATALRFASGVLAACVAGCDRSPAPPAVDPAIRGDLIVPLTNSTRLAAAPATPPPSSSAPANQPAPGGPRRDSQTGRYRKLGFDTLASYTYQARVGNLDPAGERSGLVSDDVIPEAVRAWDGQRVALSGFVMPLGRQGRGVTEFLLARDQLSCCFGASPQMNHWVHVQLPRGSFRPVIFLPATVEGTLHVGELRKNGSLQSIYRLDADNVIVTGEPTPPATLPTNRPSPVVPDLAN